MKRSFLVPVMNALSWRRKIGFASALILAGLCAALAGAELFCRLFASPQHAGIAQWRAGGESPYLVNPGGKPMLRYKANVVVSGPGGSTIRATNSLGFRDREAAWEKSPETWRVLLLGDSVTAADPPFDLPVEHTWENRLEDAVNARNPVRRVEIVNLAVGSYDAALEAQLLESVAARLRPDAVWIAFVTNDIHQPPPRIWVSGDQVMVLDVFQDDPGRREASFWLDNLLMNHSQLYRQLRIGEIARETAASTPAREQKLRDAAWKAYQRILELSRGAGAQVGAILLAELNSRASYRPGVIENVHQVFLSWMAQLGVPVIDTTGLLDHAPPESLRIFPDDVSHLNARGHLELAKALAPLMCGPPWSPETCP
ncbi:MAG: hypothetical protein GMKNLPBB_01246 [Myxococcota bacterium]|nr:hypothetical protein [Myxococcota bacterium]